MLMYSIAPNACLEHSNFLTVTEQPACGRRPVKANVPPAADFKAPPGPNRNALLGAGYPRTAHTSPTTSFLTATTLIYAIGAGITAAAGTRLALQWILDGPFNSPSFQLPSPKRPGIVIFCHYLPESGLGNLRACCLLRCSSQFSSSFSGIEP